MSEPCILASRCLSGEPCRYHGRPDRAHRRRVERIAAHFGCERIVWLCPEILGGLPVPRPAARKRQGRYWADGIVGGTDMTPALEKGAKRMLARAKRHQPRAIVLFANSPTCDPERGVAGKLLPRLAFVS
jgi:uncharacterized protein YbbK (DUF523 family)